MNIFKLEKLGVQEQLKALFLSSDKPEAIDLTDFKLTPTLKELRRPLSYFHFILATSENRENLEIVSGYLYRRQKSIVVYLVDPTNDIERQKATNLVTYLKDNGIKAYLRDSRIEGIYKLKACYVSYTKKKKEIDKLLEILSNED